MKRKPTLNLRHPLSTIKPGVELIGPEGQVVRVVEGRAPTLGMLLVQLKVSEGGWLHKEMWPSALSGFVTQDGVPVLSSLDSITR